MRHLITILERNYNSGMKGGSFKEFVETYPTLFSVIIKSMQDVENGSLRFTDEIVKDFNIQQQLRMVHPMTCDKSSSQCECNLFPNDHTKEGVLIARRSGWICPCGQYEQPFNPVDKIN